MFDFEDCDVAFDDEDAVRSSGPKLDDVECLRSQQRALGRASSVVLVRGDGDRSLHATALHSQ